MAREVPLAIAGVVMLGRLVSKSIADRGYEHPWGDTLPAIRSANLVFVSLECALAARTERARDGFVKPFYFRSEPQHVEALRAAAVDVASVANNHIFDSGFPGLLDTLDALDRAGMGHVGAGSDLDGARAPAFVTAERISLAVVAAADYPQEWASTASSAGINYLTVSTTSSEFRALEKRLTELKSGADFVVFSIHWGPNMGSRPTEEFKEFARAVINAGADLAWGHSAHFVQGIERRMGTVILYDTGDFIDDYAVDPAEWNDLSGLFLVPVRPHEVVEVRVVPARTSDSQVNREPGAEREFFVSRFRRLCDEAGTALIDEENGLVVAGSTEHRSDGAGAWN